MPTTSEEQYLLELINDARMNPLANAQRFITSFENLASSDSRINSALKSFGVNGTALYDALKALPSVGVLAWNDSLASAAASHNAAMIETGEQSHQVKGEAPLSSRIQTAGYTGFSAAGENVYAYAQNLIYAHAGFMVDWGTGPNGMQSPAGHRLNIMSADFTEVGIDVAAERDPNTPMGNYVVTQDFGSRGKLFVTGVAYADGSRDGFYTIGEGSAGLKIAQGSKSVTTGASGGFSLETAAGEATFTLTGGQLSDAVTVTTTMANDNLKLDVLNGTTLLTNGSITVSGAFTSVRVLGMDGVSVTTGAGNQDLRGNDGGDTLSAGEGDDLLYGFAGNDHLLGGAGKDKLYGGAGDDLIDGGADIDIAHFSGTKSAYTVAAKSDGSIVIIGPDGTDTLRNVEFLTFSDGQYSMAQMGVTNHAPEGEATQSLTTRIGTAKQFTVSATDADGDLLTYTATSAAHGAITNNGNGVFTYTPHAGYSGSDSFGVTVTDPRGASMTQTVTFTIESGNTAPTGSSSQTVSLKQDVAKLITVAASDADGDELTYVAGTAQHGSVVAGTAGAFTYTPTKGYSGSDSFVVTISDGKGGTFSQTVNLQISPVQAPPGNGDGDAIYRLFTPNNFVNKIGGTGTVTGTNGFQDITLLPQSGDVSFDASFNRGGDVIRLPGSASDYDISLVGSIAKLAIDDATISIPLGDVGLAIVFDDGVRKLYYDDQGSAKIGNQTFDGTPAQIVAPTDNTPVPSGQASTLEARVFLSPNAVVSVDGDHMVFGTNSGSESILYLGGDLKLDASFNRGGDKLYLPESTSAYEAYLFGSNVVLVSDKGKVTIPFGDVGMALNFNGEELILRYDASTGKAMIGDSAITSISPGEPDPVYDGPLYSLDVGSSSIATIIELEANTDYLLTDNARVSSNVIVEGFDLGDIIEVTGVAASEYNFANGDLNRDGVYGDLLITYNTNSANNTIGIADAIGANSRVFDLDSALTAMGGEFITFG